MKKTKKNNNPLKKELIRYNFAIWKSIPDCPAMSIVREPKGWPRMKWLR